MSTSRADAILFLKATIARYRHQLDGLQRRGSDAGGNVIEISHVSIQREQLAGLIEDATRLLSQLKTG